MRFAFDDEQRQLRAQARRFLERASSPARVREAMATEAGFDEAVWSQLASELGWAGLIIPEEHGGIGLGYVELVGLMEEVGRALLCAPYLSTVCLGANAVLLGGSEEQKRRLLAPVAAGEARLAVAVAEKGGRFCASDVSATAEPGGGGHVLRGTKRFVVDGHTADTLIVAAAIDGAIGLFVVDGDAPGVIRKRLPTMDQTRRLATIELDGARASERLAHGDAGTIDQLRRLAGIALAAEQLGGAQRCLEMAVEYAKVRTQFGRPIGSFQAIKHKCADMLVRVESARSAVYYAGWAAAVSDPELPLLAPMAQAYAAEAFFFCAAENIQIHGGIAFTWEHDAHLYFKRARSSSWLLGTADAHREDVARRIGI